MKTQTWRSDWAAFLDAVKQCYDRGLSDEAVSDYFGEKEVSWVGELRERRPYEELPGVELEMPEKTITLSDGRFATVSYLFLNLDNANAAAWEQVNPGDRVRFKATLKKENGPFTGISWSSFGEKRGELLIGTKNGKLVEVVSEE